MKYFLPWNHMKEIFFWADNNSVASIISTLKPSNEMIKCNSRTKPPLQHDQHKGLVTNNNFKNYIVDQQNRIICQSAFRYPEEQSVWVRISYEIKIRSRYNTRAKTPRLLFAYGNKHSNMAHLMFVPVCEN